jgi:AcrR family transcriptional regulator
MNQRSGSEGREAAVRARLLDATERVWAGTPPSEVTMRRIAEEAGCSLGLTYNYFDSKEELFGATVQHIAERLSERARAGGDGSETLVSLWGAMEENPAFTRLMTWLVLEGVDVTRYMSRQPVIADVARDATERGADDAALVGGMVALMGISVQSYEGLVNRAMGRDGRDPRLRAEVVEMFGAWFDARLDRS